jgi:hypothetical protein
MRLRSGWGRSPWGRDGAPLRVCAWEREKRLRLGLPPRRGWAYRTEGALGARRKGNTPGRVREASAPRQELPAHGGDEGIPTSCRDKPPGRKPLSKPPLRQRRYGEDALSHVPRVRPHGCTASTFTRRLGKPPNRPLSALM